MKGSPQTSVVGTSVVVSLLSLGVSVVSFVNQLTIARTFGVSKELTAYGIATSAPFLVSGVLGTAVGFGMVPLLVRARLDDPRADRLQGAILVRILAVAAALCLAGLLLSDLFVNAFATGLDEPTRATARAVAHASWPTFVVMLLIAQFSAMHDAAHRFLVTVVGSSGPYLGMLVGVLAFGRSLGVLAISYGMLAGALGGALFLAVKALFEADFSPPSSEQKAEIAGFFRNLPWVLVSVLVFTCFGFIDAFWAPRIDASSLPTLGYGQRLLIAVGGLVINGPFAIMVPRLARAAAEGRDADFRSDSARAVRTVVSFGAFVAGALSILALPVVTLLFQRGRFDAEATRRVVGTIPWFMAGMVPMLAVALLFRGFYARGWIRSAAALSTGSVVGYFVLSGLLFRPFGASGIAAGYALVWTLALAVALPMQWREHRAEITAAPNRRFVVSLVPSLLGAWGVVWLSGRLLLASVEGVGQWGIAIRLGLCGMGGLAAFYALSVRLFHMEDTKLIFDYFGGLFRRLALRPSRGGA